MASKWFGRFTTVSENIVKLLLLAVEVFLLLLSIFRTSIVSGYEEHTDYIIDSPLRHILLVLIVGIIVFAVGKLFELQQLKIKPGTLKLVIKWTASILFVVNLLMALYLVQNTQFEPLGDSSILWDIACQLHEGNYTDFQYLGYAERHFNQMGALFFLKGLVGLVGAENQIVLQFINVAALGIFQFCLKKISSQLFGETVGNLTLIACVLFFPLSLYVVFTYFNLISWALIALGMQQEISLFQTGRKRHLVIMVLAVFLAVQLKAFSWIAVIAMIIYGCYEGLRKKQFMALWGVLVAILLVTFANIGMKSKVLSETGAKELRTMPTLGYVAMGMQESYMAPGWYNGVHDRTYLECEGKEALMKDTFAEMIRYRFQEFRQDPGYAAWFYYHKMASQWNNPSFQGFWFGEISDARVPVPDWIQSMYTGSIRVKLNNYLNYLMTLIHTGVLLWLVLGFRDIRLKHLLPGIYFLGGFVFLVFWEAKCQYTLGFFIFLFAYCACGYVRLYRLLLNYNKKGYLHE